MTTTPDDIPDALLRELRLCKPLGATEARLALEIATLRERVAEVEADARRYAWLRERYYGFDGGYGAHNDRCVMLFRVDDGMAFSANLNDTLDAAMAEVRDA